MTTDLHEALKAKRPEYESHAAFARAIRDAGYDMGTSTVKDWLAAPVGEKRYREKDGDRALLAWLEENQLDTEQTPEKETTGEGWSTDDGYVYNQANDTYIFFLNCYPQAPYPVSGTTVRKIHKAYSDFDGDPATIQQIATQNEIPRQAFEEIKAALSLTHKSPPFTDEEFKSRETGGLITEGLSERKHKFNKEFQAEKWKETKRSAEKWRRKEYEWKELLAQYEETAQNGSWEDYEVPVSFTKNRKLGRGALLCNAQDFHLNKRPAKSTITIEEQRQKILSAFENIVWKATLNANVEEVILITGADLVHTDGEAGRTTSGTEVEEIVSGGPAARKATDLLIDMINTTRQIQDVRVRVAYVRGNHDAVLGELALNGALRHFRTNKNVQFEGDYSPHAVLTYEDHLFFGTHGDVSKKKMREIGDTILSLARPYISSTKFTTVHSGHFHHRILIDKGGIVMRQSPSPSDDDGHHHREMHTGAAKLVQGILYEPHSPSDTVLNQEVKWNRALEHSSDV